MKNFAKGKLHQFAAKLFLSSLALVLTGAQAHAAELIKEFTIKEFFGVAHPNQIIDFDFTNTVDWNSAYMVGPDGSEVPYQVLQGGKIAVQTDLPANAEKNWKLMSGRAPAAFNGGVKINESAAYLEITNGLTGVRIPMPTQLLKAPPAPVQGVLYRVGPWTAVGFNELKLPGFALSGANGVPIATNMALRFIERGPLKVVVEVSYGLWRDAAIENGQDGQKVLAPAGPGFYKSTIELQSGQPSILFEEDTDTEITWSLDMNPGLSATHGRYRGFKSEAKEYGYEADGRQYREVNGRPGQAGMDAFVDFNYSLPVRIDYYSSPISRKPMAVWEPWIFDSGWYWQLFDSNAPSSGNLAGIFAGPASRATGAGSSGVGVHTKPDAVADLVSKLDSSGNLHSVHQNGEDLWYVKFDAAFASSAPSRIATGL